MTHSWKPFYPGSRWHPKAPCSAISKWSSIGLAKALATRFVSTVRDFLFPGERLTGAFDRANAISALVVGVPGLIVVIMLGSLWNAKDHRDPFWVIAIWWITAWLMLLAWLPFGWDRYALPLIPPTVLMIGRWSVDLIQLVHTRWFASHA